MVQHSGVENASIHLAGVLGMLAIERDGEMPVRRIRWGRDRLEGTEGNEDGIIIELEWPECHHLKTNLRHSVICGD